MVVVSNGGVISIVRRLLSLNLFSRAIRQQIIDSVKLPTECLLCLTFAKFSNIDLISSLDCHLLTGFGKLHKTR
jgi:hypothetical protein